MHAMKSERGQSFIELAISMVFLLVLLAGVMDLGRLIFTYIALRDAVQEGGAFLAITPNECGSAITRIRQHTSGAVDLSAANINITVSYTINGTQFNNCTTTLNAVLPANPSRINDVCPGDAVRVTATYNNFPIATPFIGAIVGGQAVTFNTEVVDSIIVDPVPGVGRICNP